MSYRIDVTFNEDTDKDLIEWIKKLPYNKATVGRIALYGYYNMNKQMENMKPMVQVNMSEHEALNMIRNNLKASIGEEMYKKLMNK